VLNAISVNASAVVIINNSSELFPPGANSTETSLANIPVVIIGDSDADSILSSNKSRGTIYSPKAFTIDPNAIVLTLIAITLITLGAHWAVYEPAVIDVSSNSTEETQTLVFDVKTIIFYIITASIILVILYFLYQYVVYIIIAVFIIGSASGIYMCTVSLLAYIKYTKDIPEGKSCKVPYLGEISVKSVLLTLYSFILPIIWVIFRQSRNIWILQDILGSTLILGILRTVHLPNLKIATILLSVFFVYDIFFVFITPLFTKDGKSVMVKVATGGDDHQEVLPLTIMLPHFIDVYKGVCGAPSFSMLGYGDIIMPGFVISLCLACDNFFRTKIYFFASLIGYIIGLLCTYIALLIMESAQPALLYLVPCVLGSIFLVAWRRGEFQSLWTGKSVTVIPSDKDKDLPTHEGDLTKEEADSENIPLMENDSKSGDIIEMKEKST